MERDVRTNPERSTRKDWHARIFMLRGGRIFAVLAMAGGVLTCVGAISAWIRVYDPAAGIESAVYLRPISGPRPPLAFAALLAGVGVLALGSFFIFVGRADVRVALAAGVILLGAGIAAGFWDLQLDDPISYVPEDVRGAFCESGAPGCLDVRAKTGMIELGGWVTAFFGFFALIRARYGRSSPQAGQEGAPALSTPLPTKLGHNRRRVSDLRTLVKIVVVGAMAAVIGYLGLIVAYILTSGE